MPDFGDYTKKERERERENFRSSDFLLYILFLLQNTLFRIRLNTSTSLSGEGKIREEKPFFSLYPIFVSVCCVKGCVCMRVCVCANRGK